MDRSYCLKNNVTVRREFFGCIVCNASSGQYFQFNSDAFQILKQLSNSETVTTLKNKLLLAGLLINDDDLYSFIDELDSKELIHECADGAGATIIENSDICLRNDCLSSPVTCTIYITEFCSKQCKHCVTISSPHVTQEDDLDLSDWIAVLHKLKDWGVFSLVFTGGEPLFKKDIFSILKKADELDFSISLLTDFDGITQKHISKLKEFKNLNNIQTSLDGAKEETHDFVRGRGSYKKTIKRMKLFSDNDLPFTISSAIHKGNINEIEGIVSEYFKYNTRYLYLNPVAPYGRAAKEMNQLILEDHELKQLAYKYYKVISRNKVNSGNAFWQNLTDKDVINPDFHPYENCLTAMSIGAYVFSINSKGDCYLDSKMKSVKLLKLGNIQSDDPVDMWNDSRLDVLRKNFNGGNSSFIDHELVSTLVT